MHVVLHHPFRRSSEQYCSREVKRYRLLSFIEMEKEKNQFLQALKIEKWWKEKDAKKKEAEKETCPYHPSCNCSRHICGDLKRERKGIFQVPIEVNDEII